VAAKRITYVLPATGREAQVQEKHAQKVEARGWVKKPTPAPASRKPAPKKKATDTKPETNAG